MFHWAKGSPDPEDQGAYYKQTWWEQLDDGKQFTRTRKFLMIMPILSFFAASHESGWVPFFLAINTAGLALVSIPKLPMMHSVRLFKINSD